MNQFLLDSNVIINIFNGNVTTAGFLEKLVDARFFISIVSCVEVMSGSFKHGKTISQIENDLDDFIRIPVDEKIGRTAAYLFQSAILKSEKIKNFQDGMIAATALTHKMPLITYDKADFKRFKGLKIISPK